MTRKPLNFTQVETLRKHMLISKRDMAVLCGVSRPTYYGWVKGKPMRKKSDDQVRNVLRKLLGILNDHNWPTPNDLVLTAEERTDRLFALMGVEREGSTKQLELPLDLEKEPEQEPVQETVQEPEQEEPTVVEDSSSLAAKFGVRA